MLPLSTSSRSGRWLQRGLILLAMTLLMATDILHRLDLVAYDQLLRLSPEQIQPDVAIVAIDEASLYELGRWPWPRERHGQLLQQLQAAQARTVVLDILFTEPDLQYPEHDRQLIDAIRHQGQVILPLHLHQRTLGAPLSEILPLPELAGAAAGLGHAHVELDQDGIARGFFLHLGMGQAAWPALTLALLEQTHPELAAAYRPVESLPESVWSRISSDYRLIPYAGPAGTIPTYSYADVLAGRLPQELLRDRVIFIGATAAGMGDILPTPYSGLAAPMPGVEVHANIYNALVQDRLIQDVPRPIQFALSLVLVLILLVFFPRLAPERNLPLTLSLIGTALLLSLGLLHFMRLWFAPMVTVVTLMLAYLSWSWQRLISLNRFLGQEVQRLSQEPALLISEEQLDPRVWAHRVIRLLEPDAYRLIRNQETMAGSDDLLPPSAPLPIHQWNASDDSFWLNLGLWEEQPWLLGLQWQTAEDRPEPSRLQGLIPLPARPPASASSRSAAEQVALRILQVRQGISSLRSLRQFISESFDHLPEAILVTDGFGQILYTNAQCRQWFQPDAHSSVLDLLEPYPPQPATSWVSLARQVLIEEQSVTASLRVESRELLVHMHPFTVSGTLSHGLIASFSDITTVREEQRRRLETIDFVSHDLRSPLVSQLALFEQLAQAAPDQLPQLLERARQYSRKSLELADQFLQLTRVEAAEEITVYDCDLLAVLENAVEQTLDQASGHQIAIHICEQSEEAWLTGNAELLERVVVNLLTNAIKYSPPHTRVAARVYLESEQACLEIQDQGIGIPPEIQSQIFERYRQAPEIDRQRVASAGLGLRFVKLVVEKHLGEIEVQSTPGEGTCFRLRFPLAPELAHGVEA